MLETIVTMNLSFMVFTFRFAAGGDSECRAGSTRRGSSRRRWRDNAIRITVGYFVIALCFSLRC
jgi:hypothetical protein